VGEKTQANKKRNTSSSHIGTPDGSSMIIWH